MSGPGSHPGVVIVECTTDTQSTAQSLGTALDDGYDFVFVYAMDNRAFAVFAQGYKTPSKKGK